MINSIVILGTTQDGGYPQLGCRNKCCKNISNSKRFISSLAILDNIKKKYWLIDITPDFQNQIKLINKKISSVIPDGIFLTHAHIGHYTGLAKLGKEVINSHNIPVYTMPRMKSFLSNNAPWNQLVNNKNIILKNLENNIQIQINDAVSISPFLVPHRNEISECVGYKITSQTKSIIYLPDIDSWENWEIDLKNIIKENDILFLDGTFFSDDEIPNRDFKTIPHPSIKETLNLLDDLNETEKNKIYFTHFNHTNNLLYDLNAQKLLHRAKFNIAVENTEFDL